jgi:hypothetical protein
VDLASLWSPVTPKQLVKERERRERKEEIGRRGMREITPTALLATAKKPATISSYSSEDQEVQGWWHGGEGEPPESLYSDNVGG